MIRETTDALVRTGLRDVGYRYVNLDDCWQKTRSPSGEILPDENAFPSGMKALSDYVHGKGMLFGLYSSAGKSDILLLSGSRALVEHFRSNIDAKSA